MPARDVFDDGKDEQDDVLSDYQQENLRFWTAVLDGYSFSDVTVGVPAVTNESSLYVKVRHSGFGGWGLTFASYLYRKAPGIGCYLTCRKDIPQAVQIYENVTASLEELRSELGDDLECWRTRRGGRESGSGDKQDCHLPRTIARPMSLARPSRGCGTAWTGWSAHCIRGCNE